MAPPNGSDDNSSDYPDPLDEVMEEALVAERLGNTARQASDDPRDVAKAERALEKAFETESESRREKQIHKALEIDPGCIDALTIVARSFAEPSDAMVLLEAAVEVAERRLGPALFAEQSGHFWEIYETRPYLRALYALAEAEFDSMAFNDAFGHFNRILDLSEGDNLGVRFVLIGALLAADRLEEARQIAFERFPEDELGFMLWARTLILFLERDFDAASEMLQRAKEANPHVESFLIGEVDVPEDMPALYSLGSEEEAAIIASDLALPWSMRPLALIWLKVGGKPGDDRYFGAYTDSGLAELVDKFADEDDFDDELDDEDDGPYLLN